jgi:hypothetical protein
MTLSPRSARAGTHQDRLGTTAKLIGAGTPQARPPKHIGRSARTAAEACVSVRWVPELLEVASPHDEVARFVGRSDFLKCAQARLDPGTAGRKALACGGGVAVALYVETYKETPRFGLIHPALPL